MLTEYCFEQVEGNIWWVTVPVLGKSNLKETPQVRKSSVADLVVAASCYSFSANIQKPVEAKLSVQWHFWKCPQAEGQAMGTGD